MEKTVSSHPARGGTHWALLLAPVAVTGLVILGALVFALTADVEPAERPEVERVDLAAVPAVVPPVQPAPDPGQRGGSVVAPETARESSSQSRKPGPHREIPEAPEPMLDPEGTAPDSDDTFDEDDEFVDTEPSRELTEEERREAKVRLRESITKVPFLGKQVAMAEARREEERAAGETVKGEGNPTEGEPNTPPANEPAAPPQENGLGGARPK